MYTYTYAALHIHVYVYSTLYVYVYSTQRAIWSRLVIEEYTWRAAEASEVVKSVSQPHRIARVGGHNHEYVPPWQVGPAPHTAIGQRRILTSVGVDFSTRSWLAVQCRVRKCLEGLPRCARVASRCFCRRKRWHSTRWSTTLSSKVNLHHAIHFMALWGANLVT